MNRLILRVAQILGRLHLWYPTALALSKTSILTDPGGEFQGRLAYACMMSARQPRTRKLVATMIRRERDRSSRANLWLARICWSLGEMNLAALLYRRYNPPEYTPTQRQLVESLSSLAEQIRTGSIVGIIAGMVDALDLPEREGLPLVIAPISSSYIDLYTLWDTRLRKHLNGHQVLIALDERVSSVLPLNFDGSVLDFSKYFAYTSEAKMEDFSRSNIWILRVLLLEELVERGYVVYSLDLDAIVVGDLPAMLASLPSSDIVAQIDFSIPMDVARQLGFVICCGFIVIHPTPAANLFFDRYSKKAILELDDQLALNHLLVEEGVTNIVNAETYKAFTSLGLSWICPARMLVSRDLSYGTVIRHFTGTERSIHEIEQQLKTG